MTYYFGFDALVGINRSFTNGGGRTIDEGVARSALARPTHAFGDVEFYPTVVGKAAALLEALARTQGFVDGNKRTAWLACVGLLKAHGLTLKAEADAYAADLVLDVIARRSGFAEVHDWLLDNLED
ncbi:type II toxin-antitoxin system death-on-curing family toxin [Actinokineospora diospyrosa]|uniref:type II toxin-antitoxin system death-on-curing family toxin n=1 Tax=Actinokineospora diospyrosa TaxID=103728 RepID=UPI0020A41721|nr:Fic family protein [Actinokineospora diospyrosa]